MLVFSVQKEWDTLESHQMGAIIELSQRDRRQPQRQARSGSCPRIYWAAWTRQLALQTVRQLLDLSLVLPNLMSLSTGGHSLRIGRTDLICESAMKFSLRCWHVRKLDNFWPQLGRGRGQKRWSQRGQRQHSSAS